MYLPPPHSNFALTPHPPHNPFEEAPLSSAQPSANSTLQVSHDTDGRAGAPMYTSVWTRIVK